MNREVSDVIALKAVTYLLSDEKRISWLIGETGMDTTILRRMPDHPEILAGILDFLLSHENILVDFAETCDVDPTMIYKIRPNYPGFVGEY